MNSFIYRGQQNNDITKPCVYILITISRQEEEVNENNELPKMLSFRLVQRIILFTLHNMN